MRYIKLSIPVKTYVRKYIEAKYPGEIKLNFTTTLGRLTHCCLEKHSSQWHKKGFNFSHTRYKLLTDKIKILLPSNEDTFYKTGFSIPASKSIIINDFFEDQIIEEINFLGDIYNKIGKSRNQAIEHFCEDYDIVIDVDITRDAFKKAAYRYRKNLQKMAEEKRA